jgi:pseudaminic acid cytidylyltransferase
MGKVAIIPARGGSKRIPNKNIKVFAGQPIISYSINAAKDSKLFDRIILSTDSKEIAEIGKSYGAEVPFMRPSELADDFTGTAEVLIHALNWLKDHDMFYNYFCCIYATAPFLNKVYINKAFDILRENKAVSAFSVTSYPYPIFRALKIDTNNRVKMFWPEHLHSRSNDLSEAYHDAGQFYWCDTEKFLKEEIVFSSDSVPVILPRYLAQDIDTPEDWETAEKLFLTLKSQKSVKP